MTLKFLLLAGLMVANIAAGQDTFTVTGTAVPDQLIKLNYGSLPGGIQAYDLNICNTSDLRHSITSSEIYQALIQSRVDLRPIGRQIMLAAILRNQNRSVRAWLNIGLNSTTSVLSVVGQGRGSASTGTLSGVALAALIGQQLLATWSPVLTADQVEKFEAQVLEPALVMDGGSCVERTIFTAVTGASKKPARQQIVNLQFHVR